jgi:uncharacterized damage-inducible protein DinB/predicted RNase H-like HicB family nuclease
MVRYAAYLETASSGLSMAHVLALPGCCVRAANREEALQRLPGAVHAYHAWLHRHGEPAMPDQEAVEIEVAGECAAGGPFTPGDAAALFPPDREPVSPEEIEQCFRLMAHSRTDLLALAGNLPDDLLDWQPDPQSFSIRRLLRHIGNAEEWYVSRLVPPETLPSEWEHDEDMPLLEFLEMERRTAAARLARLSPEERSAVSQPAHWTDHPEELWTARKALRRFLEHEREHTAQIREVLALKRRHLLAGLAAARGELLAQLIGLDEKALTQAPLNESWTVKDALAHIAAWDRWCRQELGRMVAGEKPNRAAVRGINAFNARNVAAWREHPLDEVVAELQEARRAWVEWVLEVPEEEFFRRRPVGKWDWWLPNWIEVFREHEAEDHAAQLATWRKSQPEAQAGPRSVLLAALEAQREELLAAAAMVPVAERTSRPVCGVWTLKDVLGHIADWEQWCLDRLRAMAAGRPPALEKVTDETGWNRTHAEARRGQAWEQVWADFQGARQALLDVLAGMSRADLGHSFPGVWDAETRPYAWALLSLEHDREHARDIRDAMSALADSEETAPGKTWKSRGRK